MKHLTFKDEKVMREALSVAWHPILIDIYQWIASRQPGTTITSAYRAGGGGIHDTNPLRAFDLRSWDILEPEYWHDAINAAWSYDYTRPAMRVCVLHAVCPKCGTNHDYLNGGLVNKCRVCGTGIAGNFHFHVQCHPHTRKLTS